MRTRFLVTASLLGALGCTDKQPAAPADAATDIADAATDIADVSVADVNLEGIPAPVAAHPTTGAPERLTGLDGPVDVVYDAMGWPHIYASSLRDAAQVQGFIMARDRMPQMEMLRRVASGTLAERFGALVSNSSLVDRDLAARVLGLRRAATAMWAATMPGRDRTLLEFYARGVNQYLQQVRDGNVTLPSETALVIDQDTPEWTPVDSLVIGRYQSYSLSYDAGDDVDSSLLAERATRVFEGADAMMQPGRAARRGFLADVLRWAPSSPVAVVPDFLPRPVGMASTYRPDVDRPAIGARLADSTANFRRLSREIAEFWGDETRGSNNWVVHPSASMSGRALLANDPHLSLTSPAIWWGSHLTVTRGADAVDVAGTTFPGIPGVIIGFTPRLAWGVTTAGYDVTDVYAETVTPGTGGAPDTVRFNGAQVPIVTMEEVVNTGAGNYTARFEYVPHHGPIIPEISNGRIVPRTGPRALSIKWTGHQPTTELTAFLSLAYARTAAEGKAAVNAFGVGAQNFVIADIDGAVEYTSRANIPVRAAGALTWSPSNLTGTHPCSILPGTGEAEWTGNVPNNNIPQATLSAMRPVLSTANNDQAGVTFDGNPFDSPVYLGCYYPSGWRAERIQTRLRALGARVTLDDMKSIQGDAQVEAGARYRPFLAQALARLELEWTTPGSQSDLAALATALRPRQERIRDAGRRIMTWTLDSPSGFEEGVTAAQRTDSAATTIFHGWLGQVVRNAFDDELAALNEGQSSGVGIDRVRVALYLLERPMDARTRDMVTGQSLLWDDLTTAEAETRDLILLRALDRALAGLETAYASPDVTTWLWGRFHTVQFESIVPGPGANLSIPRAGDTAFPRGFPRHGGIDAVDAANFGLGGFNFSFGSGASQRFVVELDPAGPRAFNAIPGGQTMVTGDRHFRDGAELWRRNQYHRVPLTVTDVVGASERHLRFTP